MTVAMRSNLTFASLTDGEYVKSASDQWSIKPGLTPVSVILLAHYP